MVRYALMVKDGRDPLKKLSSEDLIGLCRSGDAGALSELISRFAPAVIKRAESFKGEFWDDLAQEGFLALLGAVKTYSPDRGASFATYAQLVVKNRMISVFKRVSSDHDELPDEFDLPDDPSESPENVVLEQESLDELYRKIESSLSKLEFDVFKLYAAGFSYESISQKLSITEKTVDNAVQRMRKKLRNVLR